MSSTSPPRSSGMIAPDTSCVRGGIKGLTLRFEYLKGVLGIPTAPFTLGSIRGGGAVWHYCNLQSLGLLQFRGRWKSAASMNHYIQVGTCSLAFAQLPSEALDRIRQLAALVGPLCDYVKLGKVEDKAT